MTIRSESRAPAAPFFTRLTVPAISPLVAGLAVILLMTPAALHRLGFQGEDDPEFFEIGSRLVIAASIPLAMGISADVAVVFFKTTDDTVIALSAGAIAVIALLTFWLIYPLWHRARFRG